MSVRFYLVPLEFSLDGRRRGSKYFPFLGDPDPPALMSATIPYALQPFGAEPTALLAADVDAAQHTTLAGLADVTVIPQNLDSQLGANLATVQAQLEALNIPANAVTATNTYRQVLRGVIAIFSVSQRFYSIRGTSPAGSRLFPPGITFATTLGDLSVDVRSDLQTAATQLGYDYSGLTLTSTLRQVLNKLASQPAPFTLLEVTV